MSTYKNMTLLNEIRKWNTAQLVAALELNGLGECCGAIEDRGIDGESFLNLTEGQLQFWKNSLNKTQIRRLWSGIQLAKERPHDFLGSNEEETQTSSGGLNVVKTPERKISSPFSNSLNNLLAQQFTQEKPENGNGNSQSNDSLHFKTGFTRPPPSEETKYPKRLPPKPVDSHSGQTPQIEETKFHKRLPPRPPAHENVETSSWNVSKAVPQPPQIEENQFPQRYQPPPPHEHSFPQPTINNQQLSTQRHNNQPSLIQQFGNQELPTNIFPQPPSVSHVKPLVLSPKPTSFLQTNGQSHQLPISTNVGGNSSSLNVSKGLPQPPQIEENKYPNRYQPPPPHDHSVPQLTINNQQWQTQLYNNQPSPIQQFGNHELPTNIFPQPSASNVKPSAPPPKPPLFLHSHQLPTSQKEDTQIPIVTTPNINTRLLLSPKEETPISLVPSPNSSTIPLFQSLASRPLPPLPPIGEPLTSVLRNIRPLPSTPVESPLPKPPSTLPTPPVGLPVHVHLPDDDEDEYDYIDEHTIVNYKKEVWYQDIDRREASKLLKGQQNGAFIVRPSTQHACSISVVYNMRIYNLAISYKSGSFILGKNSFTSIQELVKYFSETPLVLNGPNNTDILCTLKRK